MRRAAVVYLDCGMVALEALWKDEVVLLHPIRHVHVVVVELQQPLVHPCGSCADAVPQASDLLVFPFHKLTYEDVGCPLV
jgi:hypothetical protein